MVVTDVPSLDTTMGAGVGTGVGCGGAATIGPHVLPDASLIVNAPAMVSVVEADI
jgi:hypothetical protein